AEDGIRDFHVTGVQTCALPILLSGENIIGSDTVAKLLSVLRKNEDVKAVILRIDSGGGSALASDIISREVELFSQEKEKKPIIRSEERRVGKESRCRRKTDTKK